jgi:aryl-alcohol dehydrogenase-like predicted oxidoreductase
MVLKPESKNTVADALMQDPSHWQPKWCFYSNQVWLYAPDPEYVREAAERSLQKLGVEYIDLYHLHREVHPSYCFSVSCSVSEDPISTKTTIKVV